MKKEFSVEDMVNDMHQKQSEKLVAEFDKFMEKMNDKYISVIMPHVIAQYCINKENRRPNRIDVLSITSTVKKNDNNKR